MPGRYQCAECGKQYDVKEFDMGDKDYCCHACLMEGRKKIVPKKEPDNKQIRHFSAGGYACH